ncbi:flagellar hook-length control protein FliK, partial [Curtobacterium sp. UCD-KPL2560]
APTTVPSPTAGTTTAGTTTAATTTAATTAVGPAAPIVATLPAGGTADQRAGHGTDARSSGQGDPGLPAVAAPRGGETPFVVPATTAAAPAAPAAPAPAAAPAPLAQQLVRPLFTLAHAGHGEHVVTVQVQPDALGPVTVRALVTAHGMHVELFAASDAGREAVRQVLPDLRRDAGAGVATTLDLSSQNHPGSRDDRPAPGAARPDTGLEARPAAATPVTTRPSTVRSVGLDVLA